MNLLNNIKTHQNECEIMQTRFYTSKVKYSLVLFLIMSWSFSCKKPPSPDPYPAVTSEGKNIWACKLNGTPLVYTGKSGFTTGGVDIGLGFSNNFIISASGKGYLTPNSGGSDHHHITIDMKNVKTNEKYFFNSDTCFYEYYNYYLNEPPNASNNSYYQSGWVKFIKLDNIVAGEFECKVANLKGDTLSITEGRFDILK